MLQVGMLALTKVHSTHIPWKQPMDGKWSKYFCHDTAYVLTLYEHYMQ
jgi:hypothetical protein